MDQLRGKRHTLVQTCRLQEIELPLKSGQALQDFDVRVEHNAELYEKENRMLH